MTKGNFRMVELVYELHHISLGEDQKKFQSGGACVWPHHRSSKVVMLKVGLHHESLRMVKLEVGLHYGCPNSDHRNLGIVNSKMRWMLSI